MSATKVTPHRIFIVDDHPIFRDGLAQVINREQDLTVCGEAASVAQALERLENIHPDLIIIDISLAGSSGIDLIRQLKANKRDELPILVISMHDESLYAERVIRMGAQGYIMKQESSKHMKDAIRRVLAGEVFLSEKIAQRMASHFKEKAAKQEVGSPLERLSARELEVFRMIGRGMGTRQIAEELGLTVPTINSFRARIKEKLNLSGATELALHAISWVQNEA